MRGRRLSLLACAGILLAMGVYRAVLQPQDPLQQPLTVREAWIGRRSGSMVEATGTVQRLLADDLKGSRHQRFILQLPGRHTVLVSHNIDLAPRVPIQVGDSLQVRGQFEWNDKGGLLHWTHHDPRGERPGGWIQWKGRDYR